MFSDSHHRCPHVTEQVSQLTEKVSTVTPVLSHVCSCDMGHCTCDDFTCDILEGLFYRRHTNSCQTRLDFSLTTLDYLHVPLCFELCCGINWWLFTKYSKKYITIICIQLKRLQTETNIATSHHSFSPLWIFQHGSIQNGSPDLVAVSKMFWTCC